MFKKIVALLLVIGVVTFIAFSIKGKKITQINIPQVISNVIPSPTPFPFQSLTIPYLRERGYESRLGELTQYSDNSSFTTYLTNYDSDGLKINALLTKPKNPMPPGGYPGVVFVHGYIPPSLYKTTEKYTDYVNALARNGFVVLKIDLRGNGSSEGTPSGAYYSGDYVIDTLNAYSALGSSGLANPKKIGLWGHSMAGNIVFRSFVVNRDIPAVVIWSGAGYTYTDLTAYRIMDRSYRPPTDRQVSEQRRLLNETYGTFNPESSFWKQVPATNYLKDVTGSIEIHHAVDDPTVSIEYSRNLMKILGTTSIPHELFEYKSGGHNISGSSFTTAMNRTVEFYKEKLR